MTENRKTHSPRGRPEIYPGIRGQMPRGRLQSKTHRHLHRGQLQSGGRSHRGFSLQPEQHLCAVPAELSVEFYGKAI